VPLNGKSTVSTAGKICTTSPVAALLAVSVTRPLKPPHCRFAETCCRGVKRTQSSSIAAPPIAAIVESLSLRPAIMPAHDAVPLP
jgi:hypothetical protein